MHRFIICFLITLVVSGPIYGTHVLGVGADKERSIISGYLKDKNGNPLDYLMLIGTGEHFDKNKWEILNFLNHLDSKKKRFDSDKKFLEYVFYKVHRKYLRSFEPLTNFSEILEQGKYNCLTATAYYAIILEYFDFHYELIELTHHIYLKVNLDQQTILLESTDPVNGFIGNSSDVEAQLMAYNLSTNESLSDDHFEAEPVDLYQLIGLHYYNLAIKSFKVDDLRKSYVAINKALIFHKSPKLFTFLNFLLEETNFTPIEKALVLQSINLS